MGDTVTGGGTSINNALGCSNTTDTGTITARTADGTYTITTTIRCLGSKTIPGYAGLTFPPKPSKTSGGSGGYIYLLFYNFTGNRDNRFN